MKKKDTEHINNEIVDESKKDYPEAPYENDIDIELEETEFENVSKNDKLKKLRQELAEAKKQSQEYLTGWQKERAEFANYKTEEEKKRKERLEAMKLHLVTDFFPVLDSFDMAFSNKEAWEKVDSAWRVGVEYIHTQLIRVIEDYGIHAIDTLGVTFDPLIHEPTERVSVDSEEKDNTVIEIIQKGYRSGDIILRPAKVKVGSYDNTGN